MQRADGPRRAVAYAAACFLVALLMGAYGFVIAATWMA